MAYNLGKCHFCKNGKVEIRKITKGGHKINSYVCSNANWYKEDEDDIWELTKESTCSFNIRQDALFNWGKRSIKSHEIKKLLKEKELIVDLYSSPKKTAYQKYIILNKEYGLEVLWEIDINKDKNES